MEETVTEAVSGGPEVVEQAEAVMQAVASGSVDRSMLHDFWDAVIGYIPVVIAAIVIYLIGMLITKIIMKLVNKGMNRTKIDGTAQSFLESLTRIILNAFTIIISLSVLGIPMTSIVTAVGAAGLAIGLALQSSLSNIAGGFLILMNKPFSTGDYICTNGTEGIVSHITILNTTLKTLDNKVIYIPNGTVSNSMLINYSREPERRVDLVFGVSYDCDFRKAEQIVLDICKDHPKIMDQPAPPFARVGELAGSSVNITVRVWTKNSDYWDVYFDLNEQVLTAFAANGITVPFNQLDVHVK
ncbi:MAG: mechanosensitive ion channel family protein [Huintestinicola sp.]